MAKARKTKDVSAMLRAAVESGLIKKAIDVDQVLELSDRMAPVELGWYVVGGSGYVLVVADDDGESDDEETTEDTGTEGDTGDAGHTGIK